MGKITLEINLYTKKNIFMWFLIKNKAPAWDILQKKYFCGPSICPLCTDNFESIPPLFIHYHFSQVVWKKITNNEGLVYVWKGFTIEDNLKS